jgi:hypothetical protein
MGLREHWNFRSMRDITIAAPWLSMLLEPIFYFVLLSIKAIKLLASMTIKALKMPCNSSFFSVIKWYNERR